MCGFLRAMMTMSAAGGLTGDATVGCPHTGGVIAPTGGVIAPTGGIGVMAGPGVIAPAGDMTPVGDITPLGDRVPMGVSTPVGENCPRDMVTPQSTQSLHCCPQSTGCPLHGKHTFSASTVYVFTVQECPIY